jgi:hypothetical protein
MDNDPLNPERRGLHENARRLGSLQQHLLDHFGIEHSTIQVETSMGENDCRLDSKNCV